jgi:hypothetical protein
MTNSQKVLAAIAGRFGTQDPNALQIQRWQYWDFIRLAAAGTNRLTFFSNPIGSVDPVGGNAKTLEETNIRRSGELDLPFVIMQLRTVIEVLPIGRQPAGIIALPDAVIQTLTPLHRVLRNLANLGVLQVDFGQKTTFQIEQPFQRCPPGFGVSIRSITATPTGAGAVEESLYYAQSVDPRDSYVVGPPVFVEKGQTFATVIDFFLANTPAIPVISGATPLVQVGIILDGYVIRPVQ